MSPATHDIVIALIAAGVPTLVGMLNRKKVEEVKASVAEVHVMMNSRFTEMMEMAKNAWYAKGHLAGQSQATAAEAAVREKGVENERSER